VARRHAARSLSAEEVVANLLPQNVARLLDEPPPLASLGGIPRRRAR
jgi:hypothetical protein